jgi:predicted CxxxxCH...CXXCH cytochrome family protein
MKGAQIRWRSVCLLCLLLLASLLAVGCSSGNENSGLNLVDAQGNHPQNFLSTHPARAQHDGGLCTACHGDDLRGGISGVSCFSASRNGVGCHANGPAFHPASWLNKTAGPGFHGAAYTGNALIRGLACTGCHEPATSSYNCLECHFNEGGTQRVPTGSVYVHGSIGGHGVFGPLDAPNAATSVCINCHATNNRFGHMPQPFCHNCHSPAPPSYHPAGWASPDSHGTAATAAPSLSSGLENCRACHGSNFSGGSVGISCFPCHGVNAPHSPAPWRISGGSARTHTNADGGNAPACFLCHADGLLSSLPPPPPPPPLTPPGCFNNTLCHGALGHAVPFLDPDHLGVTQSEFDNVTTGCGRCHAVTGASPVPDAPACQVCHTAGSPLSPTGSFGICTSCHGYPPDGGTAAAYPNIAGAHAKHLALGAIPGGSNAIDCDTCHDGLGFVTRAHYDRANARPGMNVLRVEPGDVNFIAGFPYTSRTGGPTVFDNSLVSASALTCTAVSCHGGPPLSPAPNWRTGTISTGANGGCRACHKAGSTVTPQLNDVTNDVHPTHILHAYTRGIDCTICHDPAQLTPVRHFGNLADNVIPAGVAPLTIQPSLLYNPAGGVTIGSCTGGAAAACHAGG